MSKGAPRTGRRVLRGLTFRLLALLLGLTPFVLLELFLVIADGGHPVDHGDPFFGFRAITPLFVPTEDGRRYEIAAGRQSFFQPDSFAATKAPDEYRIFCLGGSTVQGRPFSIETSFTTWLELSLQTADPGRRYEVVNCGGVSYASYRLVPILSEVLGHSPDLILIYTGHNEFLEDRTYGHIKMMPEIIAWPLEQCSRLRTFTLLRQFYIEFVRGSPRQPSEHRPLLPGEVDARLDHTGGLDEYRRDEEWRRGVLAHFRHGLHQLVSMCRRARVPVILLHPVSNLRDCRPFKSEHRRDLGAGDLERWNSLCSEARKHYRANLRRAIQLLRQAIEIDGEHAAVHYEFARCLDLAGRVDEARGSYELSRELDICPLRILQPMSETILEIAEETGTPLIDVHALFARLSESQIPGRDWLLDHVHPSIEGHRLIADALAREMVRLGIVDPIPDWEPERRQRFEEHISSLDDFYFARGMQRLEAVRAWARGNADEFPPSAWAPGEKR